MQKWEYWKANLPNRNGEIIKFLNDFGEDGWELASIESGIAYFKRPLQTIIGRSEYGFQLMREQVIDESS